MQKVDISNIVIPNVPDSFDRKNPLYMMSNNVIKKFINLFYYK